MAAYNSNYSTTNKNMLKNPKIPWWLSWPILIIVTIAFWPVGVFLIWKRISVDRKTAMAAGRLISIFGWISVAFAGIGILAYLPEGITKDDVYMALFFLIAGIVLVLLGRNTAKNAEKFKKYISIIVNHEETSIDNIAMAMPTSYEKAKEDLQKMINRGYFADAYINDADREIVLPSMEQSYVVKAEVNVRTNTEVNIRTNTEIEMVVVSCKGCGANNKIEKGTVGECQFCGSPISE